MGTKETKEPNGKGKQVSYGKDVKVREMRTAETILNIIQDRGKIGQSLGNKETREPCAVKMARPVVCPAKAGVFSRRETYQGKSQSPVARRAGGRETNLLKPLDSLIFGMGASLQAVAQANAEVASKVRSPGGRACNREGEGSMGRS